MLEMALREVRDEALKVVQSSPKTLVLIEFARDKYFDALRAFGWANLSNAYFLYMNVELNTCIARVHKRASQRHYADDTFVTEEIMREYYKEDDLHRLQQALRPERIRVIDNNSNNQTAAWMTVRTAIQNWCLSQSGETRSLLVAHTLF